MIVRLVAAGREATVTRLALLVAASASLLVATTAALLLDPSWLAQSTRLLLEHGRDTGYTTDGSFVAILLRNLGVCAFLYSGVISAGITTIAAVVLTSFSIGVSMAVVQDAAGLGSMLSDVIWYAPIEFAAFLVAAAAGIAPVLNAVLRVPRCSLNRVTIGIGEDAAVGNERGALRRYFGAFPLALRLGIVAVAGIVLAAGVEATVIAIP